MPIATKVDVAAFGAHPDDVELSCGATLAKLAALGYATAAIDLTHGEAGTRGDRETRDRECAAASRALGLARRLNLDLADSRVIADEASVRKAVEAIRELRPAVVIAPYWREFHPDHVECTRIAEKAVFLSGLAKYQAAGEPHRPLRLLYSMYRAEFRPSFVVDVSAWFSCRLDAIMAYKSQFFDPSADGPPTDISRPGFMERIEIRAKYYGNLIGAEYGEPFFTQEMMEINDPVKAFSAFHGNQGSGLI